MSKAPSSNGERPAIWAQALLVASIAFAAVSMALLTWI